MDYSYIGSEVRFHGADVTQTCQASRRNWYLVGVSTILKNIGHLNHLGSSSVIELKIRSIPIHHFGTNYFMPSRFAVNSDSPS